MSQGNWGGGPGGGWGGGQPPGGGGYGPPGGGAPPGGGGYGPPPGGQPPGGGGYGQPPGGGFGQPPGGGGFGQPPSGGGYGAPPGGGGYGAPPGGGGYGAPPGGGFGGGGGFAPPPAGYPPGYSPQAGGGVVAWEDSTKGFFGRWWSTVKDVCFDARTFYASAAQNDNPWPAVTFAMSNAGLVGLVFGGFLALLYMGMGGLGALSAMGGKGASAGGAGAIMGIMSAIGIFVAILYPIMFVIQALIAPWIIGGIHHLMLVLLKGATRSYSHTVRVVGYAWAANFWIVIPIVGPLAAIVFSLIAQTVGLDETHKCGIGKAIGAIVLPIVLCCLCYCGFSFLVGMMSAGSSHR